MVSLNKRKKKKTKKKGIIKEIERLFMNNVLNNNNNNTNNTNQKRSKRTKGTKGAKGSKGTKGAKIKHKKKGKKAKQLKKGVKVFKGVKKVKETTLLSSIQHINNIGKTKKIPKICAPHIDTEQNNGSCFDKSTLLKLINSWNSSNSNNKIDYKETEGHNELWDKLSTKMAQKCGNEFCWLKQPFTSGNRGIKQLKKEIFRPSKPKLWETKPYEWLDTLNIQDVMFQYEKKYDDFKFFGAVPIDFDLKSKFNQCIVSELCKIDIKSLYEKGKTKIGVVFNLDKHTGEGSHWIGMYSDINRGDIGYWDSYGYKPPKEVVELMDKIKEQAKTKLNKDLEIKLNKKRHQYKTSECGTYCMYFIIEQLKGATFEDICDTIIKDDFMYNQRKTYYNHHR